MNLKGGRQSSNVLDARTLSGKGKHAIENLANNKITSDRLISKDLSREKLSKKDILGNTYSANSPNGHLKNMLDLHKSRAIRTSEGY